MAEARRGDGGRDRGRGGRDRGSRRDGRRTWRKSWDGERMLNVLEKRERLGDWWFVLRVAYEKAMDAGSAIAAAAGLSAEFAALITLQVRGYYQRNQGPGRDIPVRISVNNVPCSLTNDLTDQSGRTAAENVPVNLGLNLVEVWTETGQSFGGVFRVRDQFEKSREQIKAEIRKSNAIAEKAALEAEGNLLALQESRAKIPVSAKVLHRVKKKDELVVVIARISGDDKQIFFTDSLGESAVKAADFNPEALAKIVWKYGEGERSEIVFLENQFADALREEIPKKESEPSTHEQEIKRLDQQIELVARQKDLREAQKGSEPKPIHVKSIEAEAVGNPNDYEVLVKVLSEEEKPGKRKLKARNIYSREEIDFETDEYGLGSFPAKFEGFDGRFLVVDVGSGVKKQILLFGLPKTKTTQTK